jgi:hypothetical protein
MKMTVRSGEISCITEETALLPDDRALLVRVTIGDLVRMHRRNLDTRLTQEELAYRSGISFEHLNHIENYRAKVSIEVLDRIALALRFDRLSDFLARDIKRIL